MTLFAVSYYPIGTVQGGALGRIAGLGWVDFDFGCSTFCLVLLRLMGSWQKWLSRWASWWNITDQSQPNPLSDQMPHPVVLFIVTIPSPVCTKSPIICQSSDHISGWAHKCSVMDNHCLSQNRQANGPRARAFHSKSILVPLVSQYAQ